MHLPLVFSVCICSSHVLLLFAVCIHWLHWLFVYRVAIFYRIRGPYPEKPPLPWRFLHPSYTCAVLRNRVLCWISVSLICICCLYMVLVWYVCILRLYMMYAYVVCVSCYNLLFKQRPDKGTGGCRRLTPDMASLFVYIFCIRR